MYLQGDGVDKDTERGAGYLTTAAEHGSPIAQYNLGLCYAQGCGVAPSAETARVWMTFAARQGHPQAAQRLQAMKAGE